MDDLLFQSFLDVGNLYRQKEVSPVEVTRKVFERIEKTEPELNAFVTLLEDTAMKQASKAEKLFLNKEETHLLTGIPFSVKDLFYTKEVLTTCASNVLKDFKPDYTATVVQKLNETNAVLFGKNNMLEFAYGIVHPDFGQTNNPWDITKTSGGSSSGSAASVAAGIGYFSLGTDTGGSIRIPASYCGVVGLKPTRGIVSTYGVFPLSWSLDHAGPITRTAREAAVVLDVIAGNDLNDPHSATQTLNRSELKSFELSNSKKRVGVLSVECLRGLEPDVKQVYDNTLKEIESLGWEVTEVSINDWQRSEQIIMDVLLPEAAHIHKKWLEQKSDYAELTYKQIEMGMEQKAVTYLKGLDDLHRYTSSVSALFEKVDVLLTPTVAFPAPEEDPEIGSEELNEMVFTGPFNISGHPAVTINMGFSGEGLPVGMQLVGPHFHDIELLKIANVLEQTQAKKYPPFITGETVRSKK
ncbi:amidase [Pseudalkalibacillus caeni]|nr:amidase [Pseudalkalibacillus caeni]